MVRRQGTNLQHAEITPYAHKYLLRKPRTHDQQELTGRGVSRDGVDVEESARIDDPLVEKRRFELFIDLIWVGIVGNLAETFSEEAFDLELGVDVNSAAWHFIVLFLIAWRFWKYLQEFMSKYATNDMIERAFIVWALILALLWGNNAPFLFSPKDQSNLAINIYLVWRGSVLLCEAYYAFFIPRIRNRIILQAVFILPVLPLWVVAAYQTVDIKAGLAFAAVNMEVLLQFIIESPFVTNRFLHADDRGERFDADHWVERINDFYIIILGEGVLSLIRGSPLRKGFTWQAYGGVLALIIYYALSGFYFSGDQSKRHIHAVRRAWWRKNIWLFLHNCLFGATLVLGVSVVFVLDHLTDSPVMSSDTDEGNDEEEESAAQLRFALRTAVWTISISVSLAVFAQTLIALSSRSVDPPGTLKINNRILRLLPRILLLPIILCLPIDRVLGLLSFLGIISGLLVACLPWEWWSSLERGGGVVET